MTLAYCYGPSRTRDPHDSAFSQLEAQLFPKLNFAVLDPETFLGCQKSEIHFERPNHIMPHNHNMPWFKSETTRSTFTEKETLSLPLAKCNSTRPDDPQQNPTKPGNFHAYFNFFWFSFYIFHA